MFWLNLGFAIFCTLWGMMCGIGISCDVRRWLAARQDREQAQQDRPERLRVIRGGHR